MSDANRAGKGESDVAPILSAVFPELSIEELREIHEGLVRLFGFLHDLWLAEQCRSRLDEQGGCASLNSNT